MKINFMIALMAVVIWGIQAPTSLGASTWATGPDLQKRLEEPTDLVLGENPLRRALENLSHSKKIAILIDRRVDPGQKIDISLTQTPLKDALQAVAEKNGLGISFVGPVAYFAHPQDVGRVRTLVALRQEEARRLPTEKDKKFLLPKPIAWEDYSAPRDLLEKLGKENGIQIAGLDQVPHDLWAAADLPPLGLVERLTLIAGQYDLTFNISADGDLISLRPIPEHVELVRSYPAGRQPEAIIRNYAAIAPQARIRIAGDKIVVAGTLEDHDRITSPIRPAERKPKPSKSTDAGHELKRYTLKVEEKPIGPLLRQLAAQLNLTITINDTAIEQAGVSLDQRVSFSVKEAAIDELLRAALNQTNLKFTRRGNEIHIEPSGE
jgi:hypothetical protein